MDLNPTIRFPHHLSMLHTESLHQNQHLWYLILIGYLYCLELIIRNFCRQVYPNTWILTIIYQRSCSIILVYFCYCTAFCNNIFLCNRNSVFRFIRIPSYFLHLDSLLELVLPLVLQKGPEVLDLFFLKMPRKPHYSLFLGTQNTHHEHLSLHNQHLPC